MTVGNVITNLFDVFFILFLNAPSPPCTFPLHLTHQYPELYFSVET